MICTRGSTLLRLLDDRFEVVLAVEELVVEAGTVLAPLRIALHDPHPLVDVAEPGDVDAEAESIEELGTEVTLLRDSWCRRG